jgi:hypothetical protein
MMVQSLVLASAQTLAVIGALATAACGSSNASGPRGSVQVAITYSGGPPGAPPALRPGRVTASRHGLDIAHASLPAGHRVRLALPTGAYALHATSGDAQCRNLKVTIKASTTTRANIRCSVK